jgi:hypothetical protein
MKLITTINQASRNALQWRLLLIWLGAVLLPTLLLALPLWSSLSSSIDHSVHAAALAQQLDLSTVADIISDVRRNFLSLKTAGLAALVLTLLMSPLLTGVVVTAARAPSILRLRELLTGGMAEYPRMLRMLLWAVIPLGIAGALGGQLMELAQQQADKAVLETDGSLYTTAATIIAALLLALANATLDAGRAELAIDRRRTSAVKAWWRGLKRLLRQPGSMLGAYAIVTVVGLLLAGALGLGRLNLGGASIGGFLAALLVTQLMALVLAWMRAARLLALVSVSSTKP